MERVIIEIPGSYLLFQFYLTFTQNPTVHYISLLILFKANLFIVLNPTRSTRFDSYEACAGVCEGNDREKRRQIVEVNYRKLEFEYISSEIFTYQRIISNVSVSTYLPVYKCIILL